MLYKRLIPHEDYLTSLTLGIFYVQYKSELIKFNDSEQSCIVAALTYYILYL